MSHQLIAALPYIVLLGFAAAALAGLPLYALLQPRSAYGTRRSRRVRA